MFHFTLRRIEAYICIRFVAYKMHIELERIPKIKGIYLSMEKVLSIAKTNTPVNINLPICNTPMKKAMLLTLKHKSVTMLLDEISGKIFRVSKCRSQENLKKFFIEA